MKDPTIWGQQLRQRVREVLPHQFDRLALDLFRYQATHNDLYRQYLSLLGKQPEQINSLTDIPFLPIQLFKGQTIQTGAWSPQATFLSSGTTGQIPSKHQVRSLDWYHQIAMKGFQSVYGLPQQYCILALLPSYLERKGSSLVDMVRYFIQLSNCSESGFFLHDWDQLKAKLRQCQAQQMPTILWGVSFALLDFVEKHPIDFPALMVMETGGMKGRRAEMTRTTLHQHLKQGFHVSQVHSEYGMTELLSQAYAPADGIFQPAPTMKVLTADITDPFALKPAGSRGLLQVIDLANIDTCAFIATEDIGKVLKNGHFEVLGRHDVSEVRGCNLMLEF